MAKFEKIEALKEILKDYSIEEQDTFIKMVEPFYDFYDFMLEEHGMDFDMVEKDSAKYSEEVLSDYLKEMDKSKSLIEFITGIGGDILKRYSEKFNYPEPEKVKIALNKYTEIILMREMTKNKK